MGLLYTVYLYNLCSKHFFLHLQYLSSYIRDASGKGASVVCWKRLLLWRDCTEGSDVAKRPGVASLDGRQNGRTFSNS